MTAHGDQVRCHCGAGPFFASGAPSDQRPGDADPALKQIYLRVTQPTANSEEAILEAGKKRLAGDTARAATSDEVKDLRREASALKEVVAELMLENRLLKKSTIGAGEDGA